MTSLTIITVCATEPVSASIFMDPVFIGPIHLGDARPTHGTVFDFDVKVFIESAIVASAVGNSK